MSIDYFHKYKKYKIRYLNLVDLKGGKRSSKSKNNLLPIKDYQTGIIEMYFDDLSQLDALEIGVGDASESIAMSKLFRSYTGQETNKSKLAKAKKLCVKYSCRITFTDKSIDDLSIKEEPDVILLYNQLNSIDLSKVLDILTSIVDQDGIILIDQPKSKNKHKYKEYLLNVAPDKHKIRVRHFDKKDNDVYVITREDASFNIKSGPLKIPPAERWY